MNDYDQNKITDFKFVITIEIYLNEIWHLAALYLVKNNFCVDEKSSEELRFMFLDILFLYSTVSNDFFQFRYVSQHNFLILT